MLKEVIIVLKMFGKLLLLIISSFVLTLLSSNYVTTDVISTVGEGLCGDSSPCNVEILTGGLPLQYLYDDLGSSVVGVLSLGDRIHGDIFLIDVTFYFMVLLLFKVIINNIRA